MKKSILLFSVLGLATGAFAKQKSPLRLGLKAGSNITAVDMSGDVPIKIDNRLGLGFYGGGLLEISGPAGSKWKGQMEALFNFHTFKYRFSGPSSPLPFTVDEGHKVSQISVPIMVRYFVIPQLSFNAGASVNFNLGDKATTNLNVRNGSFQGEWQTPAPGDLQTIQVGALAGATYYFYKGLFADIRYNYLFGNVYQKEAGGPSTRMNFLQIGMGYKF